MTTVSPRPPGAAQSTSKWVLLCVERHVYPPRLEAMYRSIYYKTGGTTSLFCVDC